MTAQGKRIAYIRVSSASQNLERQHEMAASADKVFEEKRSAKDAKRPQLEALLDYIRDGDEVIVFSIDRLARNLRDLDDVVSQVLDSGASITFEKEHLHFSPDTSETPDHAARLMFQVMGAFAEFERQIINERRREGVAAAKAAGKLAHKPWKLNPEQVQSVKQRAANGDDKAQIARDLGVSRNVIYKAIAGAYDTSDTTSSTPTPTPSGGER